MKIAIRPLLVVLLLALVSVGSPQTVERPLGGTWVNLIGEEPTLERLEGRAVLLHYFGPRRDENGNVSKDGGLKGAYIPLLRKFHHEHDRRGLVVLGFYDGPRSELEDFFKKYDIPYPVAIGGRAREEFSVDGPNHLVFLDREGAVYWRGPTNGLWNGKLLKGIKGAKRLGDRTLLLLHLDPGPGKLGKKVSDFCAKGDLAKALKAIDAVLAKDGATPVDRTEAEELRGRIVNHVERMLAQVDSLLDRREVLRALEALDILAKELKKDELGGRARKRAEGLRADQDWAREIAAAEEYRKILEAYYRRGLSKNLKRIDKIREDYPGSKGAQKATNLASGR